MDLSNYLEYGATGLVLLIIAGILAPVIRGFVRELAENRTERTAIASAAAVERQEMREQHEKFVTDHAQRVLEAMDQVNASLKGVADRVNHVDRDHLDRMVGGAP